MREEEREVATLGGGCFWCLEAVFEQVLGVESVVSGYAGGHVETPDYETVCQGVTGHAEVVQLRFNPDKISYREVLEIFFSVHDPTTLNRQGNDVGTQYRSIIFCHTAEQRRTAETFIRELQNKLGGTVVTEVRDEAPFFEAEPYHQRYFENNPTQGYCRLVVAPKVGKLHHLFPKYAKRNAGDT